MSDDLDRMLAGVCMGHTPGSTVVVGLSGGVDSAVTAFVLRELGYRVMGLFMKNWEDDDDDDYCSSRQDWIDAVSVADVLGVEIEAVNFAAEYRDRVFAEFLAEYTAGRTPNPDVLCNAEIKFKAFLDHAMRLGGVAIATGHYARVAHDEGPGGHRLLRGLDPSKDQSYFLHRLTQAQLARAEFPIGHLLKSQVRDIARRIGLPNAAKKDSTGICFIGERPFREFLSRYLPTRPGPIVTDEGRRVGQHVGLSFYTIGQRNGIGVGGQHGGSGDAWYVARKDLPNNTLVVVQGHDHPWLLSREVAAIRAHWISGTEPEVTRLLTARTRYRQTDARCRLVPAAVCIPSGHRGAVTGDDARFALRFDEPQWATTPGQSAVVYDGEQCLGGGIIESA